MKCPLLLMGILANGRIDVGEVDAECKHDCAWYDERDSQCVLHIFASRLARVHQELELIRGTLRTMK